MTKHLMLATILAFAALPAVADKNPRTQEALADNQAYTYHMRDSVKSPDPQLISPVDDSDVARGRRWRTDSGRVCVLHRVR